MSFPHSLLREIYKDPETTRRTRRRIRAALEAVEVDYRGCRMKVYPSDNNTEFQIWRMGRTHEEPALRDILERLSGAPFFALDVGANAGSFAVRLGAQAPTGSQIHAFEPNPTMRERLLHNLSLNDLSSVTVHECAISDENGEMDLFIPKVRNLGEARLNQPFENGTKVTVSVQKLTDFLPKDGKTAVDFLKVDIEGIEDRAIVPLLTEAPEAQWPKLIFFEHKHQDTWKTDVTALLMESGYQMVKVHGRNSLLQKTG